MQLFWKFLTFWKIFMPKKHPRFSGFLCLSKIKEENLKENDRVIVNNKCTCHLRGIPPLDLYGLVVSQNIFQSKSKLLFQHWLCYLPQSWIQHFHHHFACILTWQRCWQQDCGKTIMDATWKYYTQYSCCGNMHIEYVQFRYRNNAQAIYMSCKQYTYWLIQCAVWLLSIVAICIVQYGCCEPSTILHSSSRLLMPSIFARKEVFEQFCHDNYIREKKNSKTMTQKKLNGIKAYLKRVEGWPQPYCILHITAIAILCTRYVYCLHIVPISKLYIHNMHIACNSHTECNKSTRAHHALGLPCTL